MNNRANRQSAPQLILDDYRQTPSEYTPEESAAMSAFLSRRIKMLDERILGIIRLSNHSGKYTYPGQLYKLTPTVSTDSAFKNSYRVYDVTLNANFRHKLLKEEWPLC